MIGNSKGGGGGGGGGQKFKGSIQVNFILGELMEESLLYSLKGGIYGKEIFRYYPKVIIYGATAVLWSVLNTGSSPGLFMP